MPSWKTMYERNSQWLGSDDMGDDGTVTLTVARVEEARVESDTGTKRRPIVHFRENVRPWQPCITTCECMAAMYGDDTDGWSAKPVTLWWDPSVKFGRDTVGGVRVRGAPGLGRTVTARISLPKKRPFDVKLHDTKPAQVDPSAARAKLLEAAESKHNIDKATIEAWLAEQGAKDIAAMTVDDLRGLFRALPDIAAWAAQQTPDSATGWTVEEVSDADRE